MSSALFSALQLHPDMLKTLDTLGYHEMTPIQAQSLPHILQNKDVIAKAKTGSGKTAAFGIGVLENINVKEFRIQSLILCPTRELADQVAKEIRRLARGTHNVKILTLCGGMPFGPQRGSLEHGAHIIVGTPGRVQDHIGKGNLVLDHVKILVLDEADRMLDMGFSEEILKIISNIPKERQTLLFSATYPDAIKKMSSAVQKNAVTVSVEAVHSESTIKQMMYEVKSREKIHALTLLLSHYKPASTVVFCNTKIECNEVADALHEYGFHAMALHGDLEQKERNEVLLLFANGSSSVLVATDVAARGLDIKDLSCVINYELPHDPEVYVHRIGRTGRAGKEGLTLTLFTPSESRRVSAVEQYQKSDVEQADISAVTVDDNFTMVPPNVTICIDGGKKHKVRPGDILGALTGEANIDGKYIGKIDIFDFHSYVAIERSMAAQALKALQRVKIKGKDFRVRKFD